MSSCCYTRLIAAVTVLLFLVAQIATANTINGVQPLAWYEADGNSTFTTATGTTPCTDNSPLGRWEDQSGHGYDLRRGAGTITPTYFSNGGPISKPTVAFDGGDYMFWSTDGTGATLQLLPDGQTIKSIFVVFKPASTISSGSSAQHLLVFTPNGECSVRLGSATSLLDNEIVGIFSKNANSGGTGTNEANGYLGTDTISNSTWSYLEANYNSTGGPTSGSNPPSGNVNPSYDIRLGIWGSILTNGWSYDTASGGSGSLVSTGPIMDYNTGSTQTLSIQVGGSTGLGASYAGE